MCAGYIQMYVCVVHGRCACICRYRYRYLSSSLALCAQSVIALQQMGTQLTDCRVHMWRTLQLCLVRHGPATGARAQLDGAACISILHLWGHQPSPIRDRECFGTG